MFNEDNVLLMEKKPVLSRWQWIRFHVFINISKYPRSNASPLVEVMNLTSSCHCFYCPLCPLWMFLFIGCICKIYLQSDSFLTLTIKSRTYMLVCLISFHFWSISCLVVSSTCILHLIYPHVWIAHVEDRYISWFRSADAIIFFVLYNC